MQYQIVKTSLSRKYETETGWIRENRVSLLRKYKTIEEARNQVKQMLNEIRNERDETVYIVKNEYTVETWLLRNKQPICTLG